MEGVGENIYIIRSFSKGGQWGDAYDGVGVIVIKNNEAEGKAFLGEWPIRNTLALRKQLQKLGVGVFRCDIKGNHCEWRWKNRINKKQ